MDSHHYDSAPPQGDSGNLPGFDAEFRDIVDYILRITYRIWEGKQVGLCRDYYSEDCPVYTLAGYSEGAEVVTANTLRTLAAFPDRSLHADNIIWGGDAESGFHSSHLITTHMTNHGPSEFGPATGREASIQVIAHCVCRDNRIVEEWLVRDNLSLARQLGVDIDAWLAERVRETPAPEFRDWLDSEWKRVSQVSRTRQPYPADDNEAFVAAALNNIWNANLVGDCNVIYDPSAVIHASARYDLQGIGSIAGFYMSILGSVPDARLSVDYLCSQSMRDNSAYVAARWTLAGTHTGGSLWGPPTGAPILILGESHYRFKNGKVVEEWLVFDELAVLTQVARARHDAADVA
ncbi:MAG: ester cyclase [Pseudomonadota bacterium]